MNEWWIWEGIPDVSEETIFYDSLVVPKDFDKCELIETSSFMPQVKNLSIFLNLKVSFKTENQ